MLESLIIGLIMFIISNDKYNIYDFQLKRGYLHHKNMFQDIKDNRYGNAMSMFLLDYFFMYFYTQDMKTLGYQLYWFVWATDFIETTIAAFILNFFTNRTIYNLYSFFNITKFASIFDFFLYLTVF